MHGMNNVKVPLACEGPSCMKWVG